jgi:hypothetical protein
VSIAGLALAEGRPEFDFVGDDSLLPSSLQSRIFSKISKKNPWNTQSDFPDELFDAPSVLSRDTCFAGTLSALTVPGMPRMYAWEIVLQMDVESDLSIHITDCVLNEGASSPFKHTGPGAGQTGRYVASDHTPVFNPGANPQVTAIAIPGPYAVFGFDTPFDLVNRTQGGLFLLPFNDLLYTSIGVFSESLTARMPEYMVPNLSGQTEYPLSAGDVIRIEIFIPANNFVDVRYGQYSVSVNYIGTDGTELPYP